MKHHNQFVGSGVRRWAALFFVLVVVAFGFAQAVHLHGLSATDDPNSATARCTTCVASHSVAVVANISFAPVLHFQLGTVAASEPQLESRLEVFSSYSRPPPLPSKSN